MAEISGSENADYLVGTEDDDTIRGFGGYNLLYGRGGNDTIYNGNDGGSLYGEAGNDVLYAGAGGDALFGGIGNDQLNGGSSNNLLLGDEGDDALNGGDGNDTLYGGNGADVLNGDGGDDVLAIDLWGFEYPLEAPVALDQFNGGFGNDTLWLKGSPYGYEPAIYTLGTSFLYSGIENLKATNMAGFAGTVAQIAAFDTVDVYRLNFLGTGSLVANGMFKATYVALSNEGMTVDFRAPGAAVIEVLGGSGNDTIFGASVELYSGNTIILRGGGGNDTIWGGAMSDLIMGDAGNDALHGGGGNDFFIDHAGDDSYYGDEGDDYFSLGDIASISANDWFYGGSGFDSIQISGSQGTSINLSGLHIVDIEKLVVGGAISMTVAQVAQFQAIEAQELTLLSSGSLVMVAAPPTVRLHSAGNTIDLSASTGFHQVIGNASADTILGGASYEFLYGYAGNDTISGGGGDDFIDGGTGTDSLYGGTGDDRFLVERQQDVVFEYAGEGTDTVEASSNFYLYGNIERLILTQAAAGAFGVGNDLDNYIEGNNASNLLIGGAGNDTILGYWGNDSLFGEAGADTITGDLGIDYIAGGAGDDTLDGGWDADAIYGEDGNDILRGGDTFDTDILVGGAGDDVHHANSGLGDYDILNGAGGNDTYYVDTPNDIIYEGVGEGIDTVYAGISGAGYYLWANVENCILTGTTPFAAGNELNNMLVGSAGSNWLLGNDGNDFLDGMGGNDVLFGDKPGGIAGSDTFAFQGISGQDVIGDFHHGEDKIRLIGSLTSFEQVQAAFSQNGSDGAINLGNGNIIVLQGVQLGSLTASDFIFG